MITFIKLLLIIGGIGIPAAALFFLKNKKIGIGLAVPGLFAILYSMGMYYVPEKHSGHVTTTIGTPLKSGRLIAFTDKGERGLQSKLLQPGYGHDWRYPYFMDIDVVPDYEVKAGQFVVLTARDGAMNPNIVSKKWDTEKVDPVQMIEDVEYFIKKGGERGIQQFILTTGIYRLNQHQWKNIEVYNLTEVQANEVLVIESKFGKAPAFKETSDDEILSVPLVKDRSYRGIVNEAFASGFYAIHPRTEQAHKVSIVLETFIYGGGYVPVTMDLEIDPENDKLLTNRDDNKGVALPEQKNGGAFTAKTKDNHTVRYDVRVLGQIEPVQAPRFIGTIRDPKSLDDKVIEPFTKNILSNLTLEYNALDLKDKKEEIGLRVSKILRERTIKTGFRTKTVEITNIDIPAIVLIPGKIESASIALKQALEEKEKSVEQAIKVRNMQDQADNQEELAKQTVKNQAADQEAERITKLAEANKTKAQLEADAKAYAVNQQTEANKKRIEETAQAFGVLANILGEDNATKILLQETINEKASEFQTPDVLVIGAGADQGAAIVNSHMISQSIGQSVDKAVTKPIVKPVADTQTTNSN